MPGPTDKNGRPVTVGSSVRVVGFAHSFIESLPDDEVEDIRSMIGEVFQVYEIDDHGYPWVEKVWNEGTPDNYSHSVALDASDMEIVEV